MKLFVFFLALVVLVGCGVQQMGKKPEKPAASADSAASDTTMEEVVH